MKKTLAIVVLVLGGCTAFAQDAAKKEAPPAVKKEMPAGWKMRLDGATARAEEFQFWTMPPGWHMTTGPAGIVYDPARVASGNFRVESETFLFAGDHLEGFGVFFAGKDLDSPAQSYVYFLLRKDGRFLVKAREGEKTRILIPWTEHAAIVKHGTQTTAKNVLAVEAGAESVDFFANGVKLAGLPRAQLSADGVVGLRINHHINIHVTNLRLEAK